MKSNQIPGGDISDREGERLLHVLKLNVAQLVNILGCVESLGPYSSTVWMVFVRQAHFADYSLGKKKKKKKNSVRRRVALHISYRIVSYRIVSYHIMSYHIISYHIISYHIISYHIIA